MCSLSTEFLAAIRAILKCAELFLSKHVTRGRTCICSDTRAVIAALAESTIESALVREHMQALEKISGSEKVTIVWIPGHHAKPENEETNKLAKERTKNVHVDQTAGSPFAVDNTSSSAI
jgi:ribonuclease HI